MGTVTLQLLEGIERGQTLYDLPTPITIGREDDNAVRLNDERVSRFHAKIQEDQGRIILTDLDSTNGTRVNGHPVQMRVLRFGDHLTIGRCVIVYGSREDIARRNAELQQQQVAASNSDELTIGEASSGASGFGNYAADDGLLFPNGLPGLPTGLRPHQRAEMSDVIAFVHEQIQTIVQNAYSNEPGRDPDAARDIVINWATWQKLLSLDMDVASYLRRINEPDDLD